MIKQSESSKSSLDASGFVEASNDETQRYLDSLKEAEAAFRDDTDRIIPIVNRAVEERLRSQSAVQPSDPFPPDRLCFEGSFAIPSDVAETAVSSISKSSTRLSPLSVFFAGFFTGVLTFALVAAICCLFFFRSIL